MTIDWSNVRVLSFDCYGTLIDWERGILSVLLPWAERAGLGDVSASSEARAALGECVLVAFAKAEAAREHESFRLYPDVLRLVMHDIGRDFSAPVSSADADALATSVGGWPAFPDTPAALKELKSRFRLVVASNVDHASLARTQALLGVEFDAVITAEDVRSYKPAPGHFDAVESTIAGWGISRESWVHVAQSLFHDIAPVGARGVRTVWVDRRAGRAGGATSPPPAGVRPDITVPDLRTLAQISSA